MLFNHNLYRKWCFLKY